MTSFINHKGEPVDMARLVAGRRADGDHRAHPGHSGQAAAAAHAHEHPHWMGRLMRDEAFQVVPMHVARNPVARAIAMAKMRDAVRTFQLRLGPVWPKRDDDAKQQHF